MKYLSPWINNDTTYTRYTIDGQELLHILYHHYDGGKHHTSGLVNFFRKIEDGKYVFNTLQEAQKYSDHILSKNGYVFLTDEQWDKYRALI